MSLSFSDAVGNYFNRIGSIAAMLTALRNYHNTQKTIMTDTTSGIVAQYNAESDLQAEMGSAYLSVLSAAGSGVLGVAQQLAGDTANRMVYRDSPKLNQTLTSGNLLTSLYEIVKQMKAAGATVLAATITATPSAFIGAGVNSVINTSVKRPSDGVVLENSFAETLNVVCTTDSYLGNAAEGNEGFSITGAGSQTDVSAFDWPQGSNCSVGVSAIDGNSDNSAGNLLTNSGFADFTDDVPDNWELIGGTAGTTISQENTIVFDNTGSSLKITGDAGGSLTAIRQIFGDTDGTPGSLAPLNQYTFNLFIRRDGTAPGAGTMIIDLVDSTGTVLQDKAGVANTFTITLTSLNTVFTAYKTVFRTPLVMPDTIYLRVRLSVALTDGRSVYLDKMSMGRMAQCYVGGPFVAIHSGSIPHQQGDYATVAVTNSRGSGGTLDTFQTVNYRLFPAARSAELLLPSSATPTIIDGNLIV